MSSRTTNIGLEKVTSDQTIGDLQESMNGSGGNMDIIDGKMGPVGNTSLQAQVDTLNSKILDFFATEINYGRSVTITTKGGGNRAGIVVVGEGSSVSLWAFSYRSVTQAATIVKVGGSDNRTLTISVTSAGVLTITASADCHMDVMMSI